MPENGNRVRYPFSGPENQQKWTASCVFVVPWRPSWRGAGSITAGISPAGKVVLRLNLDETSVCLWNGDDAGNVLMRVAPCGDDVRQDVRRSATRTCFTHVAIICDNNEMQPLIPQIFIGNASSLKSREMHALREMAPRNVWIIACCCAHAHKVVTGGPFASRSNASSFMRIDEWRYAEVPD